MDDDLYPRPFLPEALNLLDGEYLVHVAVALPEDECRAADLLIRQPATGCGRVVHRAVIKFVTHCQCGISGEVLVRCCKDFFAAGAAFVFRAQRPFKDAAGV